jgi:hypothetical protein
MLDFDWGRCSAKRTLITYRDVMIKREASPEGEDGWEDLPEYKRQVNQGPDYNGLVIGVPTPG